jgi:hypothetical protein
MGQPVCIGPLLDDGEWRQARDLIEMPLRHMGFELQPPDLWMRVLSHTNYYPSLIQVFCKNLLDFLHNRDRTKFDFRRCPPYPVTAEQIEQVYQSKAVRDEIKHKFELTLGLDDRYRLIALRIALASLDPGGARADGYDVAWVRDEALSWWPGGFPADGRSFEQFRTILDEMVGLGVLRRAGADGYALRSPNVLNLFGSKGQIETSLIDVSSRQPPQVYEAASFRRALGSDPWTRSPLTADQEALLAERANGVVLVFGSRPGGLDRLVEALGAVPNLAAGVAVSRRLSQVGQFEEWLRQFDESRDKQAEAVALAVVDASCDWAPHWVVKAEAYLKRKTTSKRKFLRVAFVADPALAWDWVAEDDPPVAAKEFTLRPWQETALRRWIADAELGPDAVNECGRVREVTGGWHQLIETFGQRCRDNPQNWRAVLDGLRANRPEAADWAVPPAARELVETLAQMGQPLTEAELSEFCSPPTAARALRWADRLGYAVKDVGDDAIVRWALDPLVSRAFAARGGG